jgi:hypothetical protein
MKVLIFDSGTIINLSMNGLLDILIELKKSIDGKFLITESVKFEIVDKPIGITKFELGAIRVQNLIDEGVIELPGSLNVDNEELNKLTSKFEDEANHMIQIRGKWINIVSDAEMSCLALSSILNKKGIENIIAIDERTTRMLCENPMALERIMSMKLHQNVELASGDYAKEENFRFIRSSEIVYVAFKKGIIKLEGKKALEALIYATKFKGSSISLEEIDILKKM